MFSEISCNLSVCCGILKSEIDKVGFIQKPSNEKYFHLAIERSLIVM